MMERRLIPAGASWNGLFRTLLACALLVCPAQMVLSDDAPSRTAILVAIFTPTTANNTYWPEVHSVIRAAGADLGISLEIHEFDVQDRFAKVSEGVQRLDTETRPDAAIFSVEFGQAIRLMDAAEKAGIPFFLNGPLFPEELSELGGKPGREYNYWAGYFHEDEELKGFLLAQRLIAAARAAREGHGTEPIHVAGINGARAWYGSILREAGLRRAVDEHPDVELLQMVYTRWTPEEGREMASQIMRRYPDVAVLWAASDQLALGAAEAVSERRAHGEPRVYTGGLDLSDAGIEAVLRGELQATVAATSLLWAQALIDLHDQLRGLDPAGDGNAVFLAAPVVADRSTAKDIRARSRDFESIDFRQFSRFYRGAAARRLSEITEDW